MIGANATLYMVDVDINGVNSTNIRCPDATGTLVVYRVRYGLDGDYTFGTGALQVVSDFEIRGPHSFSFTSSGLLTISAFGRFRIPWGTTFIYDPSNNSRTGLVFENRNSELYLDGGTFDAPADGVALTKGTLVIGNSVVIENYDGSLANDMRLLTLPGTRLQADGYLHNRNVGP